MEDSYFLPQGSKAYSPKNVRDLFEKAVEENDGDVLKVFSNKHKYKELIELWYASFYALAINKWLNKKYKMYSADNPDDPGPPDILFINEEDREAFPVEITELHSSAEDVWRVKGKVVFDKCHLLVVCRAKMTGVDLKKFTKTIQQYDWKFERVMLAIYVDSDLTWKFLELFPLSPLEKFPYIQYSLKDKTDLTFYY